MARLSVLRPRLAVLGAGVSVLSRKDVERSRNWTRDTQEQPWRRWYKTARWQKLRLTVLQRDLYRCQMAGCGRIEGDTSQLVCDHIEPHGGDWDRFWNGPFQTLCKSCHDGVKQRIDRAGKKASFHPEWLRPSKIPLTIVCGPPASGKSTYVRANAGPDDLIIDLDVIAAQLSGARPHGWDSERWLHPALFKCNDLLGRLSGKPRHSAAWLIVSEAKASWRQWWAAKLAPQSIIVLAVPEADCLSLALLDADRDQAMTARAIRRWWSEYKPRPDDVVLSAPGGGVKTNVR